MFVVLEFCSISYSATLQPLGRKERRARLHVLRITLLIFGTIRGTTFIVLQVIYLQHFSSSVGIQTRFPLYKDPYKAHRNRIDRHAIQSRGGLCPPSVPPRKYDSTPKISSSFKRTIASYPTNKFSLQYQ